MIQDDRSIILLSGNRMLNTPLENHDPRLNMSDHNMLEVDYRKKHEYMSIYVVTHHIYYFIILLPFLLSRVLGSSLFDIGVAG